MSESSTSRVVPLNTWQTTVRYVTVVLGFCAIIALFVAAAVHDGATTAAYVVGAVGFGFVVLVAVGAGFALRRRALVFSADSVRYASRSRPWQVAWSELTAARVEYGWRPLRPGSWVGKSWSVRLVLVPADLPAFATSHPELKVFRERFTTEGYGFPLGQARELIDPLGAGLHDFAGAANGGVRDLGRLRRGMLL